MPERAPGRGGRPPGIPRGTSDAENQLVVFLLHLRHDAGLTVEQVHRRLPEVIGDKKKVGLSTFHRRLGGSQLRNDMSLVNAVIAVCVTDSEAAKAAQERAGAMVKTSWPSSAPPRDARHGRTAADDDCRVHLQKLVTVQEQLLEANAALGTAVREKAEAEAALALRQGPIEAERVELQRQVLVVTGERDAALQAAQEAQRRISSLEALLASAQKLSSTGQGEPRQPESAPRPNPRGRDAEIAAVQKELMQLDPLGQRMTAVLAQTMERLLDGEHTGRYRWESLSRSEKTSTAVVVENLMRHDFRFEKGSSLDLLVAGVEVDLKFTTSTNWMIPPETVDGLCLLVALDTQRDTWSLGLVRATREVLAQSRNRDRKQSLSAEGRKAITWLHRNVPLNSSILTTLPESQVATILSEPTARSRVLHLFRAAQRQLVSNSDVATVTRQADSLKRIREARRILAEEGILVLGHLASHSDVARELGLPVPERGRWVSARLAPVDDGSATRSIELDGTRWRLALPDDPPIPLPQNLR